MGMNKLTRTIPVLLALLLGHSDGSGQTFDSFLQRVLGVPDSMRSGVVDSFMTANPILPFIEFDSIAHFVYRGTSGSVGVPGDANNWNPSGFPMSRLPATNFWYHSRSFESDARLDYKFVLNGTTWILDPRNPNQVSGGFGPNSELRMPGYVLAPEIGYFPGIPHGTMRDTVMFSSVLNNSRTIRVYLPAGYEISTDSFGVVVFHDGLEYVSLAQANNVLDYLIAHGRVTPLIAVFVPPVNRSAEYAGSQMNEFASFIVDVLMPYVDSRYRTRRNPAWRAMIGASNGGNISLFIGYNRPEGFGNIGAQSSNIVSSISSSFQNGPVRNLKLYLDLGTYDIPQLIPLVRNFIPVLVSRGYIHRYEEFHEGHSWGNWRAHIDNALEMFFPGPALAAQEDPYLPGGTILRGNYPNPFNPSTTIVFELPERTSVTLEIFDLLGRNVSSPIQRIFEKGIHNVQWTAPSASSGIYVYQLRTNSGVWSGKMLLQR